MVPERSNEKTVQYGTPVYEDSTGRTNEWVFCSRESRVVKERNERTPQVEHCACTTRYCTSRAPVLASGTITRKRPAE